MSSAAARSALKDIGKEKPQAAAQNPARHETAHELRNRDFAINGRFLAQPVTGVQRYGREIIRALDNILTPNQHAVRLLVPHGVSPDSKLQEIKVEAIGPARGHAWEQAALPLQLGVPLLNLCNTAPILGSNRVVCIHDANVFLAPDSYSKAFRLFYKMLQPWIARHATYVTTVSRDAAGKIARHLGVPSNRIHVAPNGHEHVWRWNAARSALRPALANARPYVLLIGSLARHKNIGRIIRLAGALDALGLDIKIVGGGAAIFGDAQWSRAANLDFLGRVSDDDLACLLHSALCLAFPSLNEGFGIPVLEAMTCRCPVVASTSTSIPEVCGRAALLADPHDDAQWLLHFKALMRSETLRDDLRGRGLEQIKKFSWARSAQLYLELMESS